MCRLLLTFALLSLSFVCSAAEKRYTLSSPNGNITAVVTAADALHYSVLLGDKVVMQPSAIALHLEDGVVLGSNCRVACTEKRSVNNSIVSPLYFRSSVEDCYNSLLIEFRDKFAVEFRAYNQGVAYRIITHLKQDYIVKQEVAEFAFDNPYNCWIAYNNLTGTRKDPYFSSFENTYNYTPISSLEQGRFAFSPVVVDLNGVKVCIAESDVESYPGMLINNPDGDNTLNAAFAPMPSEVEVGGHNKLQSIVKERHNYIAKCRAERTLPWRIVIVAEKDADLAASDMVYLLASECRVDDISWIKPGKVAWEWWNHWGITGVDFKAGINTATYKAYIDFADEYNVEYVILDEGWATRHKNDLLDIVPQIDMEEIVSYAAQKGVGIILWAGYNAFINNMEHICSHYSAMGVKGFKIDFMDRDDATMSDFYYRAAEVCAKYRLMIDFHGCSKPTGLNRTYPNVVNFEAVFGLEQMKWSAPTVDHMEYDVTMPFIRMVAGPMDYTQGAMRNASKANFRPIGSEPMSQGTRCHQLAAYAVFFSPLSMLCDSPTAYRKEAECATFIAAVPTVWEQSVVLDGKIGEYVIIARKSGDSWYVGGMTDWNSRTVEVDLSQLGVAEGSQVEMFCDGANADIIASDYTHTTYTLPQSRKLNIAMASGGGFILKIGK